MKTMACFLPLGLAEFVLSAHADVEITTDHSDAMYRCVEKAVFTVKVTAENGTAAWTGDGVADCGSPERAMRLRRRKALSFCPCHLRTVRFPHRTSTLSRPRRLVTRRRFASK